MTLRERLRIWRGKSLARKSAYPGALAALSGWREASWTSRNYAALAKEGYQRNPVGHRAVRLIAEAAASVPWLLYQNTQELHDHPALALITAPNPIDGGIAFFERLVGHLLVGGNAFIEAAFLDGTPRELHLLRPDRVMIIAGADGWPEAYDYTVDGQTNRIARIADGRCPILHIKLFHPLDDHYGLSPLEAAATAIDIHNQGAIWNKALLDNAARPSGALVYQGPESAPNLSETQFDRLKSQLEEQYQGSLNAGRPMLLEGGLSWTAMSLSPQDMEFINARNVAAREIALAFGVPPMLLGIPGDNTYANYREANLALWRQTVIPLLTKLTTAMTAWLCPCFAQGLRFAVDLDQVPALAPDRDALWARIGGAAFLSDAEKRDAVGYGSKE